MPYTPAYPGAINNAPLHLHQKPSSRPIATAPCPFEPVDAQSRAKQSVSTAARIGCNRACTSHCREWGSAASWLLGMLSAFSCAPNACAWGMGVQRMSQPSATLQHAGFVATDCQISCTLVGIHITTISEPLNRSPSFWDAAMLGC